MINFFRKEKSPIIKDLGSVAKLNRERAKTRKMEAYVPMFNLMLNDIQVNLTQGKNSFDYPYTEERLLCVNLYRSSFREWGRRHNLDITISVFSTSNPPIINFFMSEIR